VSVSETSQRLASPHCQWTNNIPSGSRQWVANDDLLWQCTQQEPPARRPKRENLWPGMPPARPRNLNYKRPLFLLHSERLSKPSLVNLLILSLYSRFPPPSLSLCGAPICIRTCKWAARYLRYGLALFEVPHTHTQTMMMRRWVPVRHRQKGEKKEHQTEFETRAGIPK
jgi:hypothetical protein